ncbi:MAG: hypothetical protein ABFD16_29405, partial [Thermoguttaceae bacterium]
MAYRKKSFIRPELHHHAPTGQACIYWGGQRHPLGAWDGEGTAPTEVLQAYLRKCELLESQWHSKAAGLPEPEDASELFLQEAINLYLHHLRNDEDGDLRSDGSLSTHYERAQTHLRPVAALFGDTWASRFTVRDLKLIRQAVRKEKPDWWEAIP